MSQLSCRLTFGIILTLVSSLTNGRIARCEADPYRLAQIIPDNSLGVESSTTRPDTIKNAPSDIIEGGATRGSNLFHSFREFGVNEGRGAYFANPDVIQNIFTRVTGGNVSNILGTLGVLGNANLFLINPSGIIFGPNARLDMRGAFIGATADSVVFDNNFEFSASNPNAPPLLTVNIPLGLRFRETSADITSTANLTTEGNLTLKGRNLNLSGTLVSGGDLTLEALDTLTIRDSTITPFIAASGGNLLLQGNQNVDIYALNHPQSGIIAGGDLVLRSENAVSGDAHYWSGGGFRIEKLDGTLGGLVSIYDPIIRASGDVYLDSYTGTSLHILAGGSVYIPNTIQITGVDTSGDSLAETVTLSDGSTINLDGSLEPTLDIRAGTTAVGSPFYDTGTPTSADIILGSVEIYDAVNGNGGKVFLTNQYQPNTELNTLYGGIIVGLIDARDVLRGGSVIIDARSGINLTGQVNISALDLSNSNVPSYLGNAGNVTLLSGENILSNSSILAQGLFGGNVTSKSTGDLYLDHGLEINVRGGGGGNITINAQNVNLLNVSKLRAGIATGLGTPEAQAGDITINATGTIAIADESFISNALLVDGIGNAGNIKITTNSLVVTDGGQISARTFGNGNAGMVKITASDRISAVGEDSQGLGSVISSTVNETAVGNAGGIEIITGSLSLFDGATVNSNTYGKGNAGMVKITASDRISAVGEDSQGLGSVISSTVRETAVGNTGGIEMITGSFFLNDGAAVNSNTYGKGNAGLIKITASDRISAVGEDSQGLVSGIFSTVNDTAEGNAGGIEIITGSLSLNDGASINATTYGKGNAELIKITASDSIFIAGGNQTGSFSSGIFSTVNDTAEGNAGGIEITTDSLLLNDGAIIDTNTFGKGDAENLIINTKILEGTGYFLITSSTFGQGDAGKVIVNATERVSLKGSSGGGISSGVYSTDSGNGGEIVIDTPILVLSNSAQLATGTFGQGNAGNITIHATESISLSKGAVLQAISSSQGNAGKIIIDAPSASVSLDGSNTGISTGITVPEGFVVTGQGNDIIITAKSLDLTNGSKILTSALGEVGVNGLADAGNILIKVADFVSLSGGSGLFSNTLGEGKAGSIEINTGSLFLKDGARIDASTFGVGNAGVVKIIATNTITISAVGENSKGNPGGIFSAVANLEAIGNAGGIEITTGSLSLEDGASVNASTFGVGDAGAVKITASGTISAIGEDSRGVPSGIFSAVANSEAIGNAGGIEITTGSLSLSDGANVNASTIGVGNAGAVKITATGTISAMGEDSQGFASGIFSTVEQTAKGNAGGIEISTGFLSLSDGAVVNASTFGVGNAGAVKITASGTISAMGENSQGFASGIFSAVTNSEAIGNSGGIEITTGFLSLSDGAQVNASTFGVGNAGAVKITASGTISAMGENSQGFASGIVSTVEQTAEGNSGGIEITTGSLSLTDGAQINASTEGMGKAENITITANTLESTGTSEIRTDTKTNFDAGDITLNISDTLTLSSSNLIAETTGAGIAGDIMINTPQFNINDGAVVSARTSAQGNGGSITVNSLISITLGENSQLNVETSGEGKAGNIEITSNTVTIGKDAQVSATATSTATNLSGGGRIKINASNLNIAGELGIFAETQGESPAGTLTLNPDSSNSNLTILFVEQGKISASTSASGNGGDINISAPNSIDVSGNGTIAVETSGSGNAGTINFNTNQLNLVSGVMVTASTTGIGNAGNINLNANQINLEQATITAFTNSEGKAGSINVPNAQSITLDNSTISTEIQTQGNATQASNINLKSNTLELNNSNITASTSGVGNAGEITLINQQLNLNNSLITAISTGVGNAGSISLPSTQNLSLTQSQISVSTTNQGNAGSITVPTAQNLNLNQSKITASTSGRGDTGIINLIASEKIELTDNSEISNAVEENGIGNALEIILNTPQLNLENSTITSSTDGLGNAGSITVSNAQTITLDNSTISTEIQSRGVATQPSNIVLSSNTLSLNNNSRISASTSGIGDAGDITLTNQQLTLDNNSQITATSTGMGNAGSINIPDTENLSLLNQSEISVSTSLKGDAGSIIIPNAQTIQLSSSSINASTLGKGNTGVINLNANQKITLTNSQISSSVGQGASGNSQMIIIDTPYLVLEDNSFLSAATAGTGDAGSIIIPNAQTIRLNNSTISSAIASTGQATQPSNITINTRQLTLNNSQITASTAGIGDAGTITITADTLTMSEQGNIQTNTASSSQAGDITLKIKEQLNLNNSILEASTDPNSSGKGGSINIDPKTVNLNNQAKISVNSQGLGDSGNISITSDNLSLNNRSEISATTASGEGGNITLNVSNTIDQRNNSPISATAGGTGNGGNITTNTRFLIGNENSNITANAFEGRGGNINITADGIFRGSNSPITASSQLGVDGVVQTNTPEVDPSRGLLNLPQNPVDPNALISQNACRKGGQSEFTVTGRGGLPSTPEQVQSSDEVEVGLVEATEQETATSKPNKETRVTRKIVPAHGWQRNDKGEMVLVAHPTTDENNRQISPPATCSSK